MPAIADWSSKATLISRRECLNRSQNFASETSSASGPNVPPSSFARYSAGESRLTLPNPRRSQNNSCLIEQPWSSTRKRRCSFVGGFSINTSPVMRGSKMSRSSLSILTTTRFPNRSIAVILCPATRLFRRSILGLTAIGRLMQGVRFAAKIVAPTTGKIPRRIVSTSGSSGIGVGSSVDRPGVCRQIEMQELKKLN